MLGKFLESCELKLVKIEESLCEVRYRTLTSSPSIIIMSSSSTTSKQITILGSTGAVGSVLALAALNRGYSLVLLVRSPKKLRKELQQGERVNVIVGNLDDKEKIKEAVKGKSEWIQHPIVVLTFKDQLKSQLLTLLIPGSSAILSTIGPV